ncbi:MAG: hypothetical protein J6I60_04460 [Bacteroidaceae bacterium]|nr:hypothetical protein [Bacteroidaceae bacterium]
MKQTLQHLFIITAFICLAPLHGFSEILDNIKIQTRPITMCADGDLVIVYADEDKSLVEISLSCLTDNSVAKAIYLQNDHGTFLVDILNITNQKATIDVSQLSQGYYYVYVETNTETLLVAYVELQ